MPIDLYRNDIHQYDIHQYYIHQYAISINTISIDTIVDGFNNAIDRDNISIVTISNNTISLYKMPVDHYRYDIN